MCSSGALKHLHHEVRRFLHNDPTDLLNRISGIAMFGPAAVTQHFVRMSERLDVSKTYHV